MSNLILPTLILVLTFSALAVAEPQKGPVMAAYGPTVLVRSMGFSGISKSELASPVKVALSAMTMMTVLQSEGYALIP